MIGYVATGIQIEEIDEIQFQKMLEEKETLLIDVREVEETPEVKFRNERIPLSDFKNHIENITAEKIVCFCQTGKRSVDAARC